MDGIHLVVVVLCTLGTIARSRQPGDRMAEPNPRTIEAAKHFELYWLILWCSWLFLYLAFVVLGGIELHLTSVSSRDTLVEILGQLARAFALFSNNIQSMAMLGLWWELMGKTIHKEGDIFTHKNPVFAAGVVVIVLVSIFHGIILLLSHYDRYAWAPAVANLFDAGSGVFATTAFGLFFARLESRYLGLAVSRLVAFYFYAGLQPLFPLFRSPEFLSLSPDHSAAVLCFLKTLALILKIVMFVVIRNLLVHGRILFYMDSVEKNWNTVAIQFQTFLSPVPPPPPPVDTGK